METNGVCEKSASYMVRSGRDRVMVRFQPSESHGLLRRWTRAPFPWVLGLFGLLTSLAPADEIITFDEVIPSPENVRKQYCIHPLTNKGVEFRKGPRIYEPVDESGNPLPIASPTHTLTNESPGEEFAAHEMLIISFTAGQSRVGAKVGLDRHWGFPVTARLRAFDDPNPGEGAKLTPSPDPSVSLGLGPTPVTTLLEWSTPSGASSIRRIEIEFVNPTTNAVAVEVIDDLAFSTIGPPCVVDTVPPTVSIEQPSIPNQVFTNTELLLRFSVTDNVGVASTKVIMLDTSGSELGSFAPSVSSSTSFVKEFFTYALPGTTAIRVEAADFAGNVGEDNTTIKSVMPSPDLNLWVLGVEITQGIQDDISVSTESRRAFAPEASLSSHVPLVAGKRTIVRVYPGVTSTDIPVNGARMSLYCLKTLGANLGAGTPCDGPLAAELVNPNVVIDPANQNDLTTLRTSSGLSYNFVLPNEWTRPGSPRWLVAVIHSPPYVHECGHGTVNDCDDGANFFVLQVSPLGFQEMASLLIQPIFTCIRRKDSVPPETCDSVVATASDAQDLIEKVFWTTDWDDDGVDDRFFSNVFPIADLSQGVKLNLPIMNEYADGDLTSPSGIVAKKQMNDLLNQICERLDLDQLAGQFGDTTDRMTYYAFINPPTGPSGMAKLDKPCAVGKFDMNPSRVNDNDYCRNCLDDPLWQIHYDVPTAATQMRDILDGVPAELLRQVLSELFEKVRRAG